MRNVGAKGEAVFCNLCGDVDLRPNLARVDKTGWDFFVEFPYEIDPSIPADMQVPIECRIQVKATDKRHRKVPITLSNLWRLINAQMPAFIAFFEFDGQTNVQNGFMVHVDNNLIGKVLKRMREIEESGNPCNFNKRTISVYYDDTDRLQSLDGKCLKETILHHIGKDYITYVRDKREYVQSTGFEDGSAQINFTVEGEEDLERLINVSLGIENEVKITSLSAVHCRFGIRSHKPFINQDTGKLQMPNVEPITYGKICVKLDKLSPDLSFDCKLYNSPFNAMIPDKFKKIRIQGLFFDWIFYPYTGKMTYSYYFGGGLKLRIPALRDAIKLMSILTAPGNRLHVEADFPGYLKQGFSFSTHQSNPDWGQALGLAESAAHLAFFFEIANQAEVGIDDLRKYGSAINLLSEVIKNRYDDAFMIEFEIVEEGGLDLDKEVVVVMLLSTPLGSHAVGAILTCSGIVNITDGGKYRMVIRQTTMDGKLVVRTGESVDKETLIRKFEAVEERYSTDSFQVVRIGE